MKKLITAFLLATVLLLTACDQGIVDIPIEVPDGEEVELPVDTTPEEEETPDENPTEPETVVEVITEIVEKIVEVPAEVEMMRKYKPGTYFAATDDVNPSGGYSFVVVVIDGYGDIAGVHIDETFSSRILYVSPGNELYTYIEGDGISVPNTYRLIDKDQAYKNYPVVTDAITTDDLIEGIHTEQIRVLEPVQVNETKGYINGDLNLGGAVQYKEQISLIVKKIIQDNTTYGFNLYESGNAVRTDSIAGVSIAVDHYLTLIQDILDNEAALKESTVLLDKANPTYGVYVPGTYINYSDRVIDDFNLNFGFSITVVDDYGTIAGVYMDETFNNKIIDGTFSTKGIMLNNYGVSSDGGLEWYEQMKKLSDQIIDNQGVDGLNVFGLTALGAKIDRSIATTGTQKLYTDSVAGVSVRIDRVAQSVKKSLNQALYTNYKDGVYFTSGDDGLFSILTIKNSEIESIYMDRIKTVFQAQYEFEGEEYGLFRLIRTFDLGETSVSKALLVYEKDGRYYSPVDLHDIQGIELSSSQDFDKDEELDLTEVEKAGLVVVPGNYTASIAGDSAYVNLSGWKRNNDLLISKFVESNGTHTVLLDNGDYIVAEDILYYDVSNVIELVNEALYKARTKQTTFKEVGTNTSNLLSDGEFFVASAPDTRGEISFGYMHIKNGNITTLYLDKTILTDDGTSTMFMGSTESWQDQMVIFVDHIINNQGYLVNQILDDYVYYDEDSINHVHDDSIFNIDEVAFKTEEFVEVFEQLIDQSVNNRLVTDAQYIQKYLETSDEYFNGLYFLTHQILPDFLPRTFVAESLANEYELEWLTSNDRDLDLENPENGYDVEVDDDIDEDKTIDLTMIVRLPGEEEVIYEHTYTFEILTRNSDGERQLQDPNFKLPSYLLLEDSSFTLPTNEAGTILWKSSDVSVISNDGVTFDVNENKEATLTAYMDIDGNGAFSTGEPFREFDILVMTTENAIQRVRDSIALSNIYQYIDRDFVLSNRSPVWGVTYEWKVFNPYIETTVNGDYTEVKIIRVGYDVNASITADLSIGSANNDVTKNYKILEGDKSVYEAYSLEDLAALDFGYDLQNLIVGNDLNFDELLQGLVRGSDMSFEVNDFEMFINTDGEVIANHPTKDAEFTLTAKAKFIAGADPEVFEQSWNIRILSSETMYDYVLADKAKIANYAIDLSHNSHLDVVIQLPTSGFLHNSDIVWSIKNDEVLDATKFDTSRLNEGIITILTKTGTEELLPEDSFTLTAEVLLGDISTTKDIEVDLRD